MTDVVYFQSDNIQIDRSLARFGKTSYPIANIGSVKLKKEGARGRAVMGIICSLIGIFLAIEKTHLAFGVLLIIIGVLFFFTAKPKFSIQLRTSSGDEQAFESGNENLAKEIMTALEAAISSRT